MLAVRVLSDVRGEAGILRRSTPPTKASPPMWPDVMGLTVHELPVEFPSESQKPPRSRPMGIRHDIRARRGNRHGW